MSDTITIDGVTLTTEEAGEVVAWVDEPTLPLPKMLLWSSGVPHLRPAPRQLLRLTPDLVEQLRDHCYPWREVRRDEVEPGEVFRDMDDEWFALCVHTWGRDGQWTGVSRCGTTRHSCHGTDTVLVRRPREVGTRLRDVEPGTLVERVDDGEQGRRLGWDYVHWGGGVILEGNWRLADWPGDTLVRIVEGES